MPVKRNEVNKYGKKVRPYLEYRYINIKATETPELLDEAIRFWEKHKQACTKGWKEKQQKLQAIAQRLSTKEGQREHMIKIESFVEEIELQYFFNRHDIDKAITELKKEGRLPEQYKTNYDNIIKILNREIANEETLRHMMRQMPDVILCDTDKRKEDIRKAIKDIIASSFDIRQFEKE